MNDIEMNKLACGWIAHCKESSESKDKKEFWWAYKQLYELERHDPEAAWKVILLINTLDQSSLTNENLSAGPLEDLLAKYGEQFIDRVEVTARRDPGFASLLGGVWQNAMSDEIWARVQSVWNRKGWDGIPE